MLEILSDPLWLTAIFVAAVGAAFAGGLYTTKYRMALAARKAPGAGVEIAEADQAVTQLEIIEALSTLGLSGETVGRVQSTITTVAQLKSVVAQLSGAACLDVKNKMMPLAAKYLTEQQSEPAAKETPQFLAKVILIGQFSAPTGAVHPAFRPIDQQLTALQRSQSWAGLSEEFRTKISDIEKSSIQAGPWVRSDLMQKVFNEYAREREAWRGVRPPMHGYIREPGRPYSYDVIEPTEDGMIAVKRCTSYGGLRLKDNTSSDYRICQYDPCRTEEENQFWIAVATRQMERFVGVVKDTRGFAIHGNLLTWTRFLEAIQRNSASRFGAASKATEPATEQVEEQVLLEAELPTRTR